MPEQFQQKVQYLCNAIPEEEWSGVLFYTINGSIREPETLSVNLEDILPMDKGSKAYTEYNLDDRFMDYIMEDEIRMTYKVGHIHSHNSMGVFFSGTDMEELDENSESHNFYLSLIVNNFMAFKAKIGFRGKAETYVVTPFIALDENGKSYEIDKKKLKVTKEKLYVLDCEVITEGETLSVDESFASHVTHIIDEAKKTPINTWSNNMYNPHNYNANQGIKPSAPATTIKNKQQYNKQYNKQVTFFNKEEDKNFDLMELAESKGLTDVERFVMTLINGGATPDYKTTRDVSDMLLYYTVQRQKNLDGSVLATNCLEILPNLYYTFFEDGVQNNLDFPDIMEELVELLEEEVLIYPVVEQLIVGLKILVTDFEKNGATN